MPRDLSRLLHPRTIAVFGGGWAANVVEASTGIGFDGQIWPVHPLKPTVAGHRAYRSVDDLPTAPDVAFVAVNHATTLDVVRDLADAGAGAVIAFASGFAEAGHPDRQAALIEAAGDMPVLGPNCYGMINALDGAVIWPDQQGCRRVDSGVAILSQSSNIAMTLSMQRTGLPISYIACVGNAAQTGLAELGAALLADDRVTALGIFMEGVGDAIAFAATARAAHAAGKGLVVMKAGRSEAGARAAETHTASLTGGGAASSAYLARIGASEVTSLPVLVETLKILHAHGPLDANRFVSVSCSGGEAGMVADAAMDTDIAFPPLPDATKAALADALGPRVILDNPLDYHTYIWGDADRLTATFAAALGGYDAGLFIIDAPARPRSDPASFEPAYGAIAAARAATGRPAFVVCSLPDTLDEARADALMASGVVPLAGIDTALAALSAARRRTPLDWTPDTPRPEHPTHLLDEATAKARLARAGVSIPAGITAPTPADLDAAALTPPFALKGLGIAHKTEAGAVRLHVTDPEAQPPIPGATGYLLEEMVGDIRAELLVGLARDPVYGGTLTLGIGGTEAELLADTRTLILPVEAGDIDDALRRLCLWPLLDGFRGRPKPNLDAAKAAILALQDLFRADPTLAEVEVNPLLLTGTAAIAADALIRQDIP